MKTNYVPAIVMLLAGAIYCLFGIYNQVELMDFTVQLLIVLLVFYILGGIVRMVLDKFMGEVIVKDENEEKKDSPEEDVEEKSAETTSSEDEA